MPKPDAQFFEDVAQRAEALRLEVRERVLSPELRDTAELLVYYLRESYNKAQAIAKRAEAPKAAAAKAGD